MGAFDDDPKVLFARPCESRLPGLEHLVNSAVALKAGDGSGLVIDSEKTLCRRREMAAGMSALIYDTDSKLYHRMFNGDGTMRFRQWKGGKLIPISEMDFIGTKTAAAAYLGIDVGVVKKLVEYGWLRRMVKDSAEAFSLKELNGIFDRLKAGKKIYRRNSSKEPQKPQYRSAEQNYFS